MAERTFNVSLRIGALLQSSVNRAFGLVRKRALASAREMIPSPTQMRQDIKTQAIRTAATTAAFAVPLRAAMKFESVMADVNKVVDFEPGGLKRMSREILNLTTNKRLPLTATGIGDIVGAAGQAGIARPELVRFATDAAKMGVAFDLTGKEAGSAMTGLRSIFKLNQDQTVLLGDSFNHLSNNMDATARDIVTISNRTGGMAQLIKMSGQQVGALAATFLALKTPPEIAATGINAMLRIMATADQQTPKFQDALQELGWSAEGLKAQIQENPQAAILEFLKTVKDAPDQIGTLAQLFGAEYADDIAKLVGSLDLYEKALGLVGNQSRYAGSMQKEYEARVATSSNHLQVFRNRMQRLAISFGTALLPTLNRVVSVLGFGVRILTALVEHVPFLPQVMASLIIGLSASKLLFVIGRYAVFLSLFKAGAVALRVVALRLAAALSVLAGKYKILSVAQTAAAVQFRRLSFRQAFFMQSVGMLPFMIGRGTKALFNFAKMGLGTAIVAMDKLVLAFIASPIGLAITGIALAGFLIWKYWQPIKALFVGLWQGMLAALQPVKQALDELLLPLAPFKAALQKALGPLFRFFREVKGWVVSILSPLDASASSLEHMTAVGAKFGHMLGTVLAVSVWPLVMALRALSVATLWWGSIAGSLNPLPHLRAVFSSVFNWFDQILPAQFKTAGKRLIEALGEGIKSAAKAGLLGPVVDVFNGIKRFLPGSDARQGPLSTLTASGRGLMTALGDGVRQGAGAGLIGPLQDSLASARLALGTSPFEASARPGATGSGAGLTVHVQVGDIHVQAPAGADAALFGQQVAEQIRLQINRAGHAAATSLRGALHDGHEAGLSSV